MTISCERSARLIPLQAGGDLRPHEETAVRVHVANCAPCLKLLNEHRLSRQWLRNQPSVDISGAMLEELRRSVWRRIETTPRPPEWRVRLERFWAVSRAWIPSSRVAPFALAAMALVALVQLDRPRNDPSAISTISDLVGENRLPSSGDGADEPFAEQDLLAQADADEWPASLDLSEGSELAGGAAAREDRMRIELHTGDPNIRIIWFSGATSGRSLEN